MKQVPRPLCRAENRGMRTERSEGRRIRSRTVPAAKEAVMDAALIDAVNGIQVALYFVQEKDVD